MKRFIMIIRLVLLSAILLNAQDAHKGVIVKLKPFFNWESMEHHFGVGIEKPTAYSRSIDIQSGIHWEKSSTSRSALFYIHGGPRFYFSLRKKEDPSVFISRFFVQPEAIYHYNSGQNEFQGKHFSYKEHDFGLMLNLGWKQSIMDLFTLELLAGYGRVFDHTQFINLDVLFGVNLGRKNN